MSGTRRYALLDTDFISKLYITKNGESDRLIFRILSIADFQFVCHQQTKIELARHNQWASIWLDENTDVTSYSDKELMNMLLPTFGDAAYGLYVNMLRRSSEIFSQSFFDTYYADLDQYVLDSWGAYNLDVFVAELDVCDANIGIDNNLGEIKLYTLAQALEMTGVDSLCMFCSDDRKARYALAGQVNMDCVSALAAFYLAKKYLNMQKAEAQSFFDSWMTYHQNMNQESFRVYNSKGNQLEKILGQDIFDMLYNDELDLMKDGYFRRKQIVI